MKTSLLRKKPKLELQRMLVSSQEKLRKLRFDLASGKVKNIRAIRESRKDIAKIFTILKEKKS